MHPDIQKLWLLLKKIEKKIDEKEDTKVNESVSDKSIKQINERLRRIENNMKKISKKQ